MAKKDALIKKIDVQLSGIELAQKILTDMVQTGISAIDSKVTKNLQSQLKELGNYYISGIQTQYNTLFLDLKNAKETGYAPIIAHVNFIHILLKKAKDYLNERKKNPEAAPDFHSELEELIYGPLKMADLKKLNFVEKDAELLQLSYFSYEDETGKNVISEDYWFNLNNGELYKNKSSKALGNWKFVKFSQDDSVFHILKIKDLYKSPASRNHKIQWKEEPESREIIATDFEKIRKSSSENYEEIIRSVKETLKDPLTDPFPIILLQLHKAYINNNHIVIEDKAGNKITLKDSNPSFKSETALKAILPEDPKNLTLLVCMNNDLETGILYAQPITLISNDKIVKLLF
ncbi:MAG: hypothetical protein E6772_09480 [Dysgonomonas sp.]|nr:hypothetical protein [Dysgonomonas sp.]